MIGSRRRPAKTRSEMFRDELGETFDHLKQAASHGTDTVATAVRPRMSAARAMAMGTAAGAMARMVEARKHAAQRAGGKARTMTPMMGRKQGKPDRKRHKAKRHRGRGLAGLLALGAAVGAVGALVGRRRRQAGWEEYDTSVRPPQKPVEMSSGHESQSSSPSGSPSGSRSGPQAGSQTRQPMPGKGTRGVGPLADQASSALSGATEPAPPEADATASPVTPPSRNRRG